MAKVELHKRFFGDGYTGTIDVAPGLSWADRESLRRLASGTLGVVSHLRILDAKVEDLGDTLVAAVRMLEGQLGLRLDAQCSKLDAQLDVLERIDQSLRRPAQTRAAERIANTGELLRRGRYERALADALRAVEDDPNNPAGFLAAAWASMGLRADHDAQRLFAEAAAAADGDERGEALRQAARLAFVLDDASAALELLDAADDQMSVFAQAALAYDRAVYLAESGDHAASEQALALALSIDERFAFMALTDPLLQAHPALRDRAQTSIDDRIETLGRTRSEILEQVSTARTVLASYAEPTTSEAERWRDSLVLQLGELEHQLDEVFDLRTRELTPVRSALEDLQEFAGFLLARAEQWPSRAREALRAEEEAAAAAAARRASGLDDLVSRFACEQSAIATLRDDGSWVIVRHDVMGRRQAWRAHLDRDRVVFHEIP